MNSDRIALVLVVLVGISACQPLPAPSAAKSGAPATSLAPPPPPAETGATASASDAQAALVAAYRAAHARQDVEAMLKLHWFGSADAEMELTIRENAAAELRCPLTDIKIEPVAPGTHGPTVEGDVHWRPSLEVEALMTAKFDTSRAPTGGYYAQQIKRPVGQKGGKCYFTVPLRE